MLFIPDAILYLPLLSLVALKCHPSVHSSTLIYVSVLSVVCGHWRYITYPRFILCYIDGLGVDLFLVYRTFHLMSVLFRLVYSSFFLFYYSYPALTVPHGIRLWRFIVLLCMSVIVCLILVISPFGVLPVLF